MKESFFCFVIYIFDLFRWAVVLAFDVRIEKDAQEHADNVGRLNRLILIIG